MHESIEKYLNRVKGLKAQATYERRKTDLRNFSSWLEDQDRKLTELDHLDLEGYFIEQVNEEYAPETLGARYQSVKGLYDFLTKKLELYEDSPFENLNRSDYMNGNGSKKFDQNSIIYLSPDEIEKLAEHVPNPALRNELILRMLYQTGMRRGEIVDVELDDLNRDQRSIEVYSEKVGKTRTVFYQPSLDLLLEQWIDRGYRDASMGAMDSDYLFLNEQNGSMSEKRINVVVKEAAEDAGLQEVLYEDKNGSKRYKVTAHTLRHSHAVQALKCDIDVRTLQRHMGHEKIDTTMRYLQLIDDDVRESYRKFDPTQE